MQQQFSREERVEFSSQGKWIWLLWNQRIHFSPGDNALWQHRQQTTPVNYNKGTIQEMTTGITRGDSHCVKRQARPSKDVCCPTAFPDGCLFTRLISFFGGMLEESLTLKCLLLGLIYIAPSQLEWIDFIKLINEATVLLFLADVIRCSCCFLSH